jgi:hypothetical protein
MLYRPGSARGTGVFYCGVPLQSWADGILFFMQPSSKRRGLQWGMFLAFALLCIALFFIPGVIIQPFKHQTPFGLALAMALRQRAPWGTLVAALAALGAAVVLWRDQRPDEDVRGTVIWRNLMRQNRVRPGWWRTAKLWRRIALFVVMIPVLFSTVMARLNYFEWMFHPVPTPQFESEAQSKLDKGEMILAIRLGSDARAYPIREIAYHHIVNDVVNGVPVCVTY